MRQTQLCEPNDSKDAAQHDAENYTWRNLIERLCDKLKIWRRIVTRYDKTRESNGGFVATEAVKLLLDAAHEI